MKTKEQRFEGVARKRTKYGRGESVEAWEVRGEA